MLAKSRLLPLRSLVPNGQSPKLPSETFRNRNVGTAKSRMVSHFDACPESAARTQKTKAPQTLSSHGTPLSNNPPPKTAHNHSTFCSTLAQRPVVIRFVTQSHSSRRKSRSLRVAFVPMAPRLRTWNHQTTFCHGARFLSCIWPASSFVSSLHRKKSHPPEGP
jgi:hypothetical protein